MERSKRRQRLRIRGDGRKLDACADCVGQVRAFIHVAITLSDGREELRMMTRNERELTYDLTSVSIGRQRSDTSRSSTSEVTA